MKTKYVTTSHLIAPLVCAGALLLMGSSAPAQNLFVGSYGSENITEIPTSGPQSVFASGLNYPTALAFDSSGDLFEADQFSGNIYEYTPGYVNGQTPITFTSGLNQPGAAMAFNAAGNLFINVGGTTIDEFTPGKVESTYVSGLSSIGGIAFDNSGDLFVANGGASGQITEITPAKVQITYATGLVDPDGLAFNSAGDLFVLGADGVDTITEITPGGVKTTFASGLDEPGAGIAINAAGDVFVADAGLKGENGNITEFAPNGTQLAVITSVANPVSLAFQGETLPVPEPSSIALLAAGTSILFLRRRKK